MGRANSISAARRVFSADIASTVASGTLPWAWSTRRRRSTSVDLGIAQAVAEDATRTRGVIGSPAYMPPERHQGADATVQGDVYSLGCVLWAVLTGRQPYDGTDLQMALCHLNEPVPQLGSSADRDGVTTDALNEILATAMAKGPGDGYSDMAAMGEAVKSVSVPRPQRASVPAREPERAKPLREEPVARTPVLSKRGGHTEGPDLEATDSSEQVARGDAEVRSSDELFGNQVTQVKPSKSNKSAAGVAPAVDPGPNH